MRAPRHLDLDVRDVGRKLDVDRALRRPCRLDHAVDLGGRVRGRELRLRGGHLLEGAKEVAVAPFGERVMQENLPVDGLARDRSADADDRHVLAVGARDPVHRAERADAVGDDERPESVHPRVTVGCVRSVELVAVADPGGSAAVFELLQELEVVVPGHAEDVLDPGFFESPQQILADRFLLQGGLR